MSMDSVLPNLLYINDIRTVVFEINTRRAKLDSWAESKEEWTVKCTVAARNNINGTAALLLVTTEGVSFFGRATVLNMVRDKHNPALYHYTLICLEPLKLIPTKELTDRLLNIEINDLKEPVTMSNSCPMPYQHPESLTVGDRIKTNICPEGLKYDIQILNAFQVRKMASESTNMNIYNMETFDIKTTSRLSATGVRCFIVWEQLFKVGNSQVNVTERHEFAQHIAEHTILVYNEPDVEDIIRRAVRDSKDTPDSIFVSSEAYERLEAQCRMKTDELAPHLFARMNDLFYDGVPVHKVAVTGIRVWVGEDCE